MLIFHNYRVDYATSIVKACRINTYLKTGTIDLHNALLTRKPIAYSTSWLFDTYIKSSLYYYSLSDKLPILRLKRSDRRRPTVLGQRQAYRALFDME